MRQNKLLLLLVLLMTAATGAWAQSAFTAKEITSASQLTSTDDGAYVAACMPSDFLAVDADVAKAWTGAPTGLAMLIYAIDGNKIKMARFLNGSNNATFGETWSIATFKDQLPNAKFFYTAAPTYSITLAEGTEDDKNWTISPTEATEGSPVTVTYSGEKKVKSVKAVKKEVGPDVTTFSELQAVLSAGKDVKLMNDIVCTAEIVIKSDGALTIDGNGKTLRTTSAIRAFKVGSSATVAFKNLTLTGFVSGGGPAINNSGTIVLDGCTISNCHVNNSNGGGAIESSGKLYAINTTFSGNYSGEIGGAINNSRGSLYMIGCTFTNNYTTSSNAFYGGAIGINGGTEVRLINCSFSGNKYGTNTGTNDIGVFFKPTNYTIAGCTGATIAARSDVGDITTNASGTATLDYSDLSNISFTYSVPVTVTWNNNDIPGTGSGISFTKDGVTITVGRYIDFDYKEFVGGGTFTTTLGNFTKIEVSARRFRETGTGWSGNSPKLTWTGNASSVSFSADIIGSSDTKFVFTIEPTN